MNFAIRFSLFSYLCYPQLKSIKLASLKSWIKAARLRTLPLALSSIILGSTLAAFEYQIKWKVLVLSVLTALFLQVLSNFANDYGDSEKGTDNEKRVGPKRTVQAGEITPKQMRFGMTLMAGLALVFGLILVFVGTDGIPVWKTIVFIVLGLLCIVAAVKYTVGEGAYGYRGLGDLFVFIFFGLTGVVGTFFLHTQQLFWGAWLLGGAVGFFSIGVLNLNNMRDVVNDRNSGKMTIPVRLGFNRSKLYHLILIAMGFLCSGIFTVCYFQNIWMLLPYLSLLLFYKDLKAIVDIRDPGLLDPFLKRLSISTLIFVLLHSVAFVACLV